MEKRKGRQKDSFAPVSVVFRGKLPISETGDDMVIDNPSGLKMGINDRRSHEFEAPVDQIPADLIRERGPGRYFGDFSPAVHDGAVIHKTPDIPIKAPELFLNGKKTFGVIDGSFDFPPVPYDPGIG